MYHLREFLQSVAGIPPERLTSDELYCSETNRELTFMTNEMRQSLACYTYTLVKEGWLNIVNNGQKLTLKRGDLYIYSPGFQVTILDGSDDYKAICLMADEHMTLESPVIWNLVRAAYYPLVELGHPLVHLNEEQAAHLWNRMQEFISYLNSSHRFREESLRTLHTLFALDVLDAMEHTIGTHHVSERTAELFIGFMRLLPLHFIAHHDIAFYAGELHITTTHLSRIVRQITGRTVASYINQMLLMEAQWLLQTTDTGVAAIAERLHFSDQSSFGKFFVRMKGVSPKAFRMQR